MDQFRQELKGWKLTALRLTANGRFKGYEPGFLSWLDELHETLLRSFSTSVTVHEFLEAKRRVDAKNDDYFPEICDRLERALSFADDAALVVDKDVLAAFKSHCDATNADAGQKLTDLARLYLIGISPTTQPTAPPDPAAPSTPSE